MKDSKLAAAGGRPHIAMFTPLPPRKTGIANYSWDLLQAMAPFCTVDVFVEPGHMADIPAIPGVKIYFAHEYAGREEYYATIFQIGNSPFHTYQLPYLQKHGGVVELHEANLNAWLYNDTVRCGQDWQAYRDALLLDVPAARADRYIADLQAGRPFDSDDIQASGFVTQYADKLIVHNEYTRRRLLRRDKDHQVAVIPHYAKAQQVFDKHTAREALGIPKEGVVFASFGTVARNRRLASVLYALQSLVRQGVGARLYITGGDDWGNLYDLQALSRHLGLTEYVHFTGRLDDSAFWHYLAACDAMVSLRWPYRGESSGVMSQALAVGRPQIVTDVGGFGELPDMVCLKLPTPEIYKDARMESGIVARAMKLMAVDEALREKKSCAAKAYAEEHLAVEVLARRILEEAL